MFSYHYTDKDRRKSAATRRRNAQLRRLNATKAGNPKAEKPTVELAKSVLVTEGVKKRLENKSKSENPFLSSIAGALVFIWALTFVLISKTGWFILFWLAFVLSILLVYIWRAAVKTRIAQLAGERKRRLDETEQFYASPEWQLLRKQVIKEKGRICFNCGTYIKKMLMSR